MKYNNSILKYTLLLVLTLFISCANMVTPTGGLKDTEAPYLIKSKPSNFSTNFQGKKIELEFNEYINLKDIQSQIIFSPADVNIDVKKTGRKLSIILDKEPSTKTTYILNFGDAISDYTENNIAKDLKYIFSTDDKIDSLEIKGTLVGAYKKDKIKDAIISLYQNTNDDSVFFKRKPEYTVRTNQNGEFKFTNLKRGEYKLFALKESNNNKIYDALDEEIAFYDSVIKLDSNITIQELNLFNEVPNKLKLINKAVINKKIELIYNTKSNIEVINNDENIDTIVYSLRRDSIYLYYKELKDTALIITNNENDVDTLKFKFLKNYKKNDFNIAVDNKIIGENITIKSSDYFTIINRDSLKLLEDSIEVKYDLRRLAYNKYILNYKFNQLKNYQLNIADSVFRSYQGSFNKTINNKIFFYKNEELGNLKLTNLNTNTIYELLNENGDVVKRNIIKNEKYIDYKNIFPGTYKLRIITDQNNNGKWDTGSLLKKVQAEKIVYFNTPIKVRANWDMEIEIIL